MGPQSGCDRTLRLLSQERRTATAGRLRRSRTKNKDSTGERCRKGDNVCVVLNRSSFDQSTRPGELRACASSRGLYAGRVPGVRSGFGTSCLQSEMILPHISAQPDSYSLRHMVMHLPKSQLASTPWAEVAATKTVAAKARGKTRRMRSPALRRDASSRIPWRFASSARRNNAIMMNAVLALATASKSGPPNQYFCAYGWRPNREGLGCPSFGPSFGPSFDPSSG